MKKLLVFAIMILFISVSVIPSTGTTDVKQITVPTAKGDTLYVGGNGSGNYTRIQDAIDNASDGDTVFVYDDSSPYNESVDVAKSINLIGENKETTIIDGHSYIYISADWVNISGFTIQNGGYIWGAGISIDSDNTTITGNNIISNNGHGIYLYQRNKYSTITDNNITSNNDYGIHLEWASNSNIITSNNIANNKNGISLESSDSNTINSNTITDNKNGIYITSYYFFPFRWDKGSQFNIIKDNNIANNELGIFLDKSSPNFVLKNNFIDNNLDAFFSCSISNRWRQNYWNESRVLPKLIFGRNYWLPWINIDWLPAKEPYDIPNGV